ncbi:MAG: biopolymer transporter ExbD [Gemmataceae bacterium]
MWRVRHEGSPEVIEVPSPQRVLEGLRDGDWEPTDEVRGPADRGWTALEEHPLFAEACADLEPPPAAHPDETRLDMNPLIDVALVLLIFFILTATYSTLRRSIELPPEPSEDKGKATATVKLEDIKNTSFKVKLWMEDGKPVGRIDDKPMDVNNLEQEVANYVKATGRRQMFADVAGDVPWGVEAKLYDAAKGAEVREIFWPRGR